MPDYIIRKVYVKNNREIYVENLEKLRVIEVG